MPHVNIEIKARCGDPDAVRSFLRRHNADFRGVDRQRDTYFRVPAGRLKLREGRIENHLIFYRRPDQPAPKRADVLLMRTEPTSPIKDILAGVFGVLVAVDKRREISFLENVKFHVDVVEGLGSFLEIEAQAEIPEAATPAEQEAVVAGLDRQCRHYLQQLGVRPQDLVAESYSDLLLARQAGG